MGEIRKLLTSLVVISSVLTGAILFSGDLFNQYNVNADQSSVKSLQNAANDTTSKVAKTRNETAKIGGAIAQGRFFLISVWNVISLVLESLIILPSIVYEASRIANLPVWVQNLLIGLPFIAVIVGVASAYRQWEL